MALAQVDYSVHPSNHVTYYSYPAPPRALQFHAPQPHLQRSLSVAAQAYQNQYQYATNVDSARYNSKNNDYQTTSIVQQLPAVTKQFSSPALDNAAFNLALTNQGYTTGKAPLATNAALTTATSRSSKRPIKSTTTASSSSVSSSSQIASLNVKLPLPLGITPLNIAPLPLQAGAPYTSIPNSITSYGTPYPQRKRR